MPESTRDSIKRQGERSCWCPCWRRENFRVQTDTAAHCVNLNLPPTNCAKQEDLGDTVVTTIKWLEENHKASAEEHQSKQKLLESIANPVLVKANQASAPGGGGMGGGGSTGKKPSDDSDSDDDDDDDEEPRAAQPPPRPPPAHAAEVPSDDSDDMSDDEGPPDLEEVE